MNLTSYAELAVRLVNTAYRAPGDPDPLGATSDFRALVSDRPRLAAAATGFDLEALRALRDELGELFTAAATGRDAAAMDHLNALLARSPVQPEPMIEVSDDQVAPISPISRLRPTSAGLEVTATDSVAMVEPSFGSAYVGHTAR